MTKPSFPRFLFAVHQEVVASMNGHDASEVERAFNEWAKAGDRRLEKGRLEYADRSFDMPVQHLLAESSEEYLDGPLWKYIALGKVPADKRTELIRLCAQSFWLWRDLERIRLELSPPPSG